MLVVAGNSKEERNNNVMFFLQSQHIFLHNEHLLYYMYARNIFFGNCKIRKERATLNFRLRVDGSIHASAATQYRRVKPDDVVGKVGKLQKKRNFVVCTDRGTNNNMLKI